MRLAGDLHDTLEQTLLAAHLQLNAATRSLIQHPEASGNRVALAMQLVKGLTNPEIADALHFSLGTAKAHLSSILAKLQVTDRTEAAAEAYRRGLVS